MTLFPRNIKHYILIITVILLPALLSAAEPATPPKKQLFKVVIDAGHGDHDHGATGTITSEKDINLSVAQRLAKLLARNDNFEVIMTRDNDSFVTLGKRAKIANNCSGDLFVSIHTNSVDRKSKNRTTVCGASVYTMGLSRSDENLAVAMRENSVLTLEPDYSTEYHGFDPNSAESYIIFQMDQNLHMEQSLKAANYIQQHLVSEAGRKDRGVRQAPFSVLRNTAMPAVLVELDFICNPTVEKYLASDEGRQQLAEAIYSGVEQYREETDRNIRLRNNEPVTPVVNNEPVTDTEPAERLDVENQTAEPPAQEVNTNDEGVKYKVQFYISLTPLKNNDRRLKNLRDIGSYKHQGMVKYTSGSFDTLDDAMKYLPEVKKYYPDAFIVKMENNRRID